MQIQYPGTEAIHSALQSIIKDCFWDSAVSEDDIRTIVGTDQVRLKQKLFAKIRFHVHGRYSDDLDFFAPDDLRFGENIKQVLDALTGNGVRFARVICLERNAGDSPKESACREGTPHRADPRLSPGLVVEPENTATAYSG
ncbi:MAG TPA: hypothetical protein PLE73_09250 [Spirochaetota bacterium]|nr:hypothetical protein [Spirochaetota bacterium]HPI23372.1 hypothetical protein [Spirochaetota bacterium]HPU86997.1 hypothetical protein [Spirochaetota bacterium]